MSQRDMFSFDAIIKTFQIPEAETKFQRFKKFIKDVAIAAKNKIVNFVKGFYEHAESVAVLTLASLGAAALIGELPFWVTLPWWIEGPMVIPVLSVLLIVGLINLGEYRTKKRQANV
jgi:hypothetical protein